MQYMHIQMCSRFIHWFILWKTICCEWIQFPHRVTALLLCRQLWLEAGVAIEDGGVNRNSHAALSSIINEHHLRHTAHTASYLTRANERQNGTWIRNHQTRKITQRPEHCDSVIITPRNDESARENWNLIPQKMNLENLPRVSFSPASGGRVKPRSAIEEIRTHGTIRLKK